MKRINAKAEKSIEALKLVETMQAYFADKLEKLASKHSSEEKFFPVEWLRDQGRHGGGERMVAQSGGIFNRGSINVSQVQYEDMEDKKLLAATALSTIIHPKILMHHQYICT